MHSEAAACVLLNRQVLSHADLTFVCNLPHEAEAGEFTVVHDPDNLYVRDTDSAAHVFPMYPHGHIIGGHTHKPGCFAYSPAVGAPASEQVSHFIAFREGDTLVLDPAKRYIVNPGSVGQPRDNNPRASYLEITTDGDQTLIHTRRVEYDIALTYDRMVARNYPYGMADRLFFGE